VVVVVAGGGGGGGGRRRCLDTGSTYSTMLLSSLDGFHSMLVPHIVAGVLGEGSQWDQFPSLFLPGVGESLCAAACGRVLELGFV
jgi:hypothetical protein